MTAEGGEMTLGVEGAVTFSGTLGWLPVTGRVSFTAQVTRTNGGTTPPAVYDTDVYDTGIYGADEHAR